LVTGYAATTGDGSGTFLTFAHPNPSFATRRVKEV
jgi:hypothetical protein